MKEFNINNRRYLGSKYKLLDFIKEVVLLNCPDVKSFMDLFAGTGVVGYSFNEDYDIIVNDFLYSNEVVYDTFFSDQQVDSTKLEKLIDFYNNKEVSEDNYYSLNFANTYLSLDNMKKVGFIRDHIDELYKENKINKREKSILICSLLYAIDKIANTVGHYDSYRKNGRLDGVLEMMMPCLKDQYNRNNQIYKADSNELVKTVSADLVYIDPPYNSRQYSDAYHFLENVALNQKPEVYGVAKKMDRSNIKSDYCTNKAASAFADLIEHIDAKYILVSYSDIGNKANARSNAKIKDTQILEILKKKGNIKIFEKDFNLFTTGKTNVPNHKERLFLCTVGQGNEEKVKDNKEYAKSPLNYTGGKFKVLDQLIEKFPDNIDTFYDVFCGGGNVGINIKANKIIAIDNNQAVIDLLKYLQSSNYYDLIKHLDALIEQYQLSNTFLHGYSYYDCNSSNGVGKYNKEGYSKLKADYNASVNKPSDLFLLLIVYSFNNQIRFNKKGEFNLPVGKRDLNASLRKKLELFMMKMHSKDIIFKAQDFRDIDLSEIDALSSFIYLDPPYFLGDAAYNENNGWSEKDEDDLFQFLEKCNELGISFALSNAIEHRGLVHEKLLKWCLDQQCNINYIASSYRNASYHIKDKNLDTKEVLVTNY